jgi:hypothetical protein
VILLPMLCSNDMRRLQLLISIAIALIAVAIPAAAGAKSHHAKRHHHARVADRNHNGIADSWERKFHVHSATADPDRDGVQNIGEFHNGTNPHDADSNDNGVNDGNDDANHDGIDDGDEQAGTITSFDGTTLIVTLVNGDVLKGTVNDQTEIECEGTSPSDPGTTIPGPATTRHDGGGDNGGSSDDQSSSGSTTSTQSPDEPQGDNNQNDQGDDDQGDQGDDDQGGSASCGKEALTPQTIVREAELSLTSNGAVFHSIHLGGKAPA